MNLSVEYKDGSGVLSTKNYSMSRLAFAKHLAVAGQRYAPKREKLLRIIGMFFHYSYYLRHHEFYNNRFSVPPPGLSDPTEKGQFSNLAGKAIADFLSKRIDRSLYTVNYEAAMRLEGEPINQARPDLIAFKNGPTGPMKFAIEAKGYTGGCGNMLTHKAQSQTGPLTVNFTVACVSFNMYNNIRCKYYDPINENVDDRTDGLLRELTRQYYSNLAEFLNEEYFQYREIEYQGEGFFEIIPSLRTLRKLFADSYWWDMAYHEGFIPSLILPSNIKELAKTGITSNTKPFLFEGEKQGDRIYIDNDRVGLKTIHSIDFNL